MTDDLRALGERELDVMAVLWELGSGTVTEVLEHLGVPLAYTTVLTVLRNLEAKEYVSREEEGRAHRYYPRVAQQAAQQNALSRLVTQLFGGSPEALIARLVEQHDVSPEELSRLARELNRSSKRDAAHPDKRERPSPYKAEDPA